MAAFDKGQVDVLVLDVEDICRLSATSALKRFGFSASRIHEAGDDEEVLQKVQEIQTKDAATPVIVFLPQRFTSLFVKHTLIREPFLVCTSADRTISGGHYHFSMDKTYDPVKLSSCFEQCQRWWAEGACAPGQWEAAVADVPAPVPPPVPAKKEVQVIPKGPTASAGYSSNASTAKSASESNLPEHLALGGNTLDSLDMLLPPKPPYEDIVLISLVGRGSFGRVYKARWDVAPVAVKVVEHFDNSGKESIMQFEGALAASLAHPNLVQTFKHSIRETTSSCKKNGALQTMRGCEVWIVQEWCSLGTLNNKIISKEILTKGGWPEVTEVCTEVASGAMYLHERGIIHGDLTSCNVLLVERPVKKGYTAKVSDFGLARVLDNGMSGIQTATIGTVTSMPPELFQLEGCALTKKVDVYAFGVIMWQVCTGTMPFAGLQPTQVVVMVAQGATLEMPSEVPSTLHEIFKQSVHRSPQVRVGFGLVLQGLLKIMAEYNEDETWT